MEATRGGARKGPSVVLFVFKGNQYQRPEKGSSQYIPSVVLFVLKAKLREDAGAGAVPLAVPFVAMSCNSKHIGDGLEYFPF